MGRVRREVRTLTRCLNTAQTPLFVQRLVGVPLPDVAGHFHFRGADEWKYKFC